MKFFSYEPVTGFSRHATEAEAKAAAQDAIDNERELADDGWSHDVDDICWGQITERATEFTHHKPSDPDENIDHIVDYELRKVAP